MVACDGEAHHVPGGGFLLWWGWDFGWRARQFPARPALQRRSRVHVCVGGFDPSVGMLVPVSCWFLVFFVMALLLIEAAYQSIVFSSWSEASRYPNATGSILRCTSFFVRSRYCAASCDIISIDYYSSGLVVTASIRHFSNIVRF